MKPCSLHSPWMMCYTQGTPTYEGQPQLTDLGTTDLELFLWTWTRLKRWREISGSWMPSRMDLERRRDSATIVVSLATGPMNVLTLRPSPHHPQPMPGEADPSRSTTGSPSTNSGRQKNRSKITILQKTRRRAAAPPCPKRRNRSGS